MVCLKLKAYESLTILLLLLPIFSEIQTEKNICQLKPTLPLESIAQKIRGTILKKSWPLQPFMALKRSQIVRRALPLTLCFLPPAWNGKDVKKNVKKDGAAIGQTDHLGQPTPRRSKHPSFLLFLPLVPLEEPLTSKL